MLENIKLLLGDAAANYTEEQITLCIEAAEAEVKAYCNRVLIDNDLAVCVQKIAIIRLYRLNTEGLTSQSLSGVSEQYVDGYPADITAILNRKRKMKVM